MPFTAFWLLGAINAFNLLDGMDGVASSVGAIISLVIAVMAVLGRAHRGITVKLCRDDLSADFLARYFALWPQGGLRALLHWGLPTVPADAAVFALNVVDRAYLLRTDSPRSAGLYALSSEAGRRWRSHTTSSSCRWC